MFWYYARRVAIIAVIVVGVLVGLRFGANFIQYKFWGVPHQYYLYDGVSIALWHWLAHFFGTTPKSDYISFFSFLAAAFSAWAAFISASLAKSGLLVNRAYLFCSVPITTFDAETQTHTLELAVTNYGKSPAEGVSVSGHYRIGGKAVFDENKRSFYHDSMTVIIPEVSEMVRFPIPQVVMEGLTLKADECQVQIAVGYRSAGHSNIGQSFYDYSIVCDGIDASATFDFQPYRKRPWIW